ncbi:MAG: DNA-binding protein [Pseudonocardiales bacterium]|nr:MAG: DNA-binding protein [Pseudonocardiales bacterium]
MAGGAPHGEIWLMRVLLDTNILLDVLLNRAPWATEAAAVWKAHDEERIAGYIGATTIPDIFYVARRLVGLDSANKAIRICLSTFDICTVDRRALQAAAALSGSDFEDNLQIACAILATLDAIVTRDSTGFRTTLIPALTPADLLSRIPSGGENASTT